MISPAMPTELIYRAGGRDAGADSATADPLTLFAQPPTRGRKSSDTHALLAHRRHLIGQIADLDRQARQVLHYPTWHQVYERRPVQRLVTYDQGAAFERKIIDFWERVAAFKLLTDRAAEGAPLSSRVPGIGARALRNHRDLATGRALEDLLLLYGQWRALDAISLPTNTHDVRILHITTVRSGIVNITYLCCDLRATLATWQRNDAAAAAWHATADKWLPPVNVTLQDLRRAIRGRWGNNRLNYPFNPKTVAFLEL